MESMKRKRTQGDESESDDENYVPYVPLSERKKQEMQVLQKRLGVVVTKPSKTNLVLTSSTSSSGGGGITNSSSSSSAARLLLQQDDHQDDDQSPWMKEADEEEEEEEIYSGPKSNVSLLDQHSELKKKAEARKETAREKMLKEEEKILESDNEKKSFDGCGRIGQRHSV
ncbi:DDX41 [Acanthosepion pharaonis]|uniref:DDX41 n=1 Tax=Acanthosepion pharaonis TaxID=158019 RepID=A0A812E1G6_ACAPH|nr:DDX41 [Sepia pharaonis]